MPKGIFVDGKGILWVKGIDEVVSIECQKVKQGVQPKIKTVIPVNTQLTGYNFNFTVI